MNFRYHIIRLAIVLAFLFISNSAGAQDNHFNIVKRNGDWQLLKNDQPFYIKGAVGGHSLEMLKEYGANSVRIRTIQSHLDRAHQFGFTVMANLPIRGERNGMDWDDEKMEKEQIEKTIQIVENLMNHPALMFWSVGNELDWIPPGIPHNPQLWEHLNDLAREIKKVDPNHPVMTVIGSGRFERKIQQLAQQCPDMDLVGINTYGDIAKVTQLCRQYWPKPYVVAEWGPTGHWQVPKTKWSAPIEQTSTQKAQVIFDRYTQIIQKDRSHCLGSYVFYWAEKQETTHTWYGLFRDGMKTESIDVMKYLWSGSWPANRSPAVLAITVEDFLDYKHIILKPETTYEAQVYCYDCDYDPLTYTWEIRPEVEIPENSYAGGLEKPAQPIIGLIADKQDRQIHFATPREEGAYRLFVQIEDGQKNAGYANIPFYVSVK